jgi:hypothetical protein
MGLAGVAFDDVKLLPREKQQTGQRQADRSRGHEKTIIMRHVSPQFGKSQ